MEDLGNCVLCEAQDLEVEATHQVQFNDDLIPVCEIHKELVKTMDIYNE